MGMLKLPSKPAPIARWLKPSAIDYSKSHQPKLRQRHVQDQPDATAQFTDICISLSNMSSGASSTPSWRVELEPIRERTNLDSHIFQTQHCVVEISATSGFQPKVNSWSLLHCRWVTQCRRLDNYVKHVRKGSQTATAVEHRVSLWRSVLMAPGFQVTLHCGGNNKRCTTRTCCHDIASHVSTVFHQFLDAFEVEMISKRVAQAKQARTHDVNRVFRDVRKPMPVPVHMLVWKPSATITEIVDEGSVLPHRFRWPRFSNPELAHFT